MKRFVPRRNANHRRLLTVVVSLVLSLCVALSFSPASAISLKTYEKQIMVQTNKERAKLGIAQLKANKCMAGFANRHAAWMAKTGKFKHQNLKKILKKCKLKRVGENIARGNTAGLPNGWKVVGAWMKSPGHRAIIARGEYRRIGVGVKSGKKGRYFVQVFGTPR